jgi:hypothetical protein
MNTTTQSRAMGVLAAGAAAVALFAVFGTKWPGSAETTVASGPPLRVQDVDDSDDDTNNAMQQMIQSEQQAQQQNDQAEQQFIQDMLQAQQTEQQANQ